MSLETEIANLTSKTTALIDYFNSKKTGIEAALSAAVAAAPAIARNFFVDCVAGDDAAVGTKAAPFKSLARALAATPVGGICDVTLLRDYVHTHQIALVSRQLRIRGNDKKLILEDFINPGDDLRYMAGFQQIGNSTLELTDLTVVLPEGKPTPNTHAGYSALIYAGGYAIPVALTLRLYKVKFELRGALLDKLVGAGSTLVVLSGAGTTFPAEMAGAIVFGVAKGTDPRTVPYVFTNFASL
ncbi:hypothetical protein [Pseudomonas carassii]|uniref:Uncharacterized protein n=1 Tax=Pseudomonas carassii TaxID=3115855 RepID=A0ABU7HC19_9PSED|nr:hypothetical protein [Pseudomonas sp. 137P]MEE1888497.1 hypothetical protein [Pseudomonas sp. 137P]